MYSKYLVVTKGNIIQYINDSEWFKKYMDWYLKSNKKLLTITKQRVKLLFSNLSINFLPYKEQTTWAVIKWFSCESWTPTEKNVNTCAKWVNQTRHFSLQ